MSTIGFKSPYSGERYRVSLECGASLTQQHFKDECDVNRILAKYHRTGLLDHVAKFQGDYADLSDVPDFQDAMNAVIDAQDAFLTLPSSIRKQFDNDPVEFLDFVHNPANEAEMVKMGLAKAMSVPEPLVAPVESPAAPAEPVSAPVAKDAKSS